MTDLMLPSDMTALDLYVESLLLRDGPDPRTTTSLTEPQVSGAANAPIGQAEETSHESEHHPRTAG